MLIMTRNTPASFKGWMGWTYGGLTSHAKDARKEGSEQKEQNEITQKTVFNLWFKSKFNHAQNSHHKSIAS